MSFDTVPPATDAAIAAAESYFNFLFPADYKSFLQFTNGLEGETESNYLVLWSAEELLELNQAYNVREFAPNIIIWGSDGAEDAYAFETSSRDVVKLPFIGMGHIPYDKLSDTFDEFLASQIKHKNKGLFQPLLGR